MKLESLKGRRPIAYSIGNSRAGTMPFIGIGIIVCGPRYAAARSVNRLACWAGLSGSQCHSTNQDHH